ncbi:MAG: acyl-CoA dehydrogenase family protein [Pirellulales bacterium]
MSTDTKSKSQGYSFLITTAAPDEIFTPEDTSDEHRQFAQSADEFIDQEILPELHALEKLDRTLLRSKLQKAGENGLFTIEIPEEYGGLGLDLMSQLVVSERFGACGGFSVAYGVQTGIASEPILFFGTDEQKEKYLPKLATGEWIGAYGLTEPGSGSDALSARTTATLSEDGTHYVLNGSKSFISNGGIADLYTIFAQVDGKQFTAFLVEKDTPGFSCGTEEDKMGIKSSSTTTLSLEDVKVPAANVVGEIGKGHKIALNILNLGRLKLGIGAVGAMKLAIKQALAYGIQRKQFSTRLVDFPLLQQKIAAMLAATYTSEAIGYRAGGQINANIEEASESGETSFAQQLAVLEEFSGECAINKVYDSEALDMVVDEALQMHGGYGFIEEYDVARAYRDARISRIYEGTNEINRLFITGNLFKRVMTGRLPLTAEIQKALTDGGSATSNGAGGAALADVAEALASAKRLFMFVSTMLSRSGDAAGMTNLNEHQEALAWLADVIIEIYALESTYLRAMRRIEAGDDEASLHEDVARYQMAISAGRLDRAARALVDGFSSVDSWAANLQTIRQIGTWPRVNQVEIGRRLALAAVDVERYPFEVFA